MSLTLHFHPLASYCWKALIALYENDIPFTPNLVDLGNPERAALRETVANWEVSGAAGRRAERNRPGVQHHHRVSRQALWRPHAVHPGGSARALQTRLRDRFYDLYVHLPMQKIMGDRLRAEGRQDPHGVEEARAQLRTSYAMIEQQMAHGGWAMGEDFSLADCAAAPSLFYGNMVVPFGAEHKNLTAYFERLKARPAFVRVLKEAEPYFQMVPKER